MPVYDPATAPFDKPSASAKVLDPSQVRFDDGSYAVEPSILSETLKAPARVVGGIAQEAGEAAQYLTGDRAGMGIRKWGEGVQERNAQTLAFRESHPLLSAGGDVVEGVAKMAPYLAADVALSAVAPEAGLPAAAGLVARGIRAAKAAPFATAVLPAVAGFAQGQRSYEKGVANGLTPDQALAASYAPAAVTGAGMAAMGAVSEGLQGVGGAAKSLKRQFVKHAAADTAIMMGQGVATTAAEKATGIDPTAKPLDQLKDPKAWLNAALTGGMFAGLGVAKKGMIAKAIKEHVDKLGEAEPEARQASVEALAQAVHPEDPAAQAAFQADTLDKIQAGEPVISEEIINKLTKETPETARESVLDGLKASVESGGEIDPIEAHNAVEEGKVAEALKSEAPAAQAAPEEPAAEAEDPSVLRAKRWLKDGFTEAREGAEPDAEVAAHLDDMGYTLVKGERSDRTSGGNVARREWRVEKKAEPVPEEPVLQAEPVAEATPEAVPVEQSAYSPLKDREQRLAYEDNPNLVVGRKGDHIALIDQKEGKLIGKAELKGDKFHQWSDGFEPDTPLERVEAERIFRRHMGEEARLNRGEGMGLPKAEIDAHLSEIVKKLKVPVEVVNHAGEISGLREDAPKFNGAFHNGKIYLNAEHLTSLKEAEHVLLKHELAHAGLRGILGEKGLNEVLAKAWGDVNSGVREFAKEKGIETRTKAGKLEATEEYLVSLAEQGTKHPLWDKFVALLKQSLRKLGFDMKYSDAELRSLVVEAARSMRSGEGPTRFSAAWHGSPHDFDKFKKSQIGTGEGAQAYGHGLYFAGNREVADYYKRALSRGKIDVKMNGRKRTGDDISFAVSKIAETQDAVSKQDVVDYFKRRVEETGGRADLKKALKDIEAAKSFEVYIDQKEGRLYQVELAPKEDEYLLWDKPLSEQSETVKAALAKAGYGAFLDGKDPEDTSIHDRFGVWEPKDLKGQHVYRDLSRARGQELYDKSGGAIRNEPDDKWASEALHSAGIRGIKYLDGSSRSAGEGDHNYVIFDDADVEIKAKFNRISLKPETKDVDDVSQETTTQVIKRALSDTSGNIWRAIMPIDKTIKMAQSIPTYAPIKENLTRLQELRRFKEAAGTAPSIEAKHITDDVAKVVKTDKDLETYNDLTHKATLYELHADPSKPLPWTEKTWKEAGKQKQTGLSLGQAAKEVRDLWNGLTPAQREVQQRAIAHMKELKKEHIEAQLDVLKLTFPEDTFSAAEKVAETLHKEMWKAEQIGGAEGAGMKRAELATAHGADVMHLAEQIAAIKHEGQLKGDYAPLMRFGDHIVSTFVKTAGGEGKRLEVRHFETKGEAMAEVRRIQADPTKMATYDLQPEAQRSVVNIPLEFLNKMQAAMDAKGIDPAQQEALMQDFKSARLSTMPRNSLEGNRLNREGIAGYEDSAVRSYAAYVQRASRTIANLKYGTKIDQTFRDMDNNIKAYQDPEKQWDPQAVERMASLKDNLYTLEKQHNTEKINEITKAIGKTTFLWYLSSPSVWAVQWSQPFVTTIPKMASRYGFGKAFGAYVSEAKNFTAGHFSDEKIDAFDRENDAVGRRVFDLIEQYREAATKEEKAKLSREMKSVYDGFSERDQKLLILKVMSHQGAIDLSAAHSLHDLVNSTDVFNKGIDYLVDKGGVFMRASETGSRRAAAVSAFRMALEDGKDFMKANDYASHIIDDTLFDFSSQNRAAIMKGNVGRVVGQFQFFRLHMLGKTIQLAKDAYAHDSRRAADAAGDSLKKDGYNIQRVSRNGEVQYRFSKGGQDFFSTSPRESLPPEIQTFLGASEGAERSKSEARKELAYMMGTSMALAGAGGTPLAMLAGSTVSQAIWDAASFLFGDPDDPWDPKADFESAMKDAVGEDATNTFMKGLPYLMGVDVSKRIGLGGMANVIQGEVPPGASPTDRANWYAAKLLGPSWGLVTDGMKTFDALGNGDYGTAMQAGSPKVLRDFMKAYDVSQDGVKGPGGRTVLQAEDVNPFSVALQMVGINPSDISLAQEEAREFKNATTELKQRRSLLMKRVTDATLAGDMDARESALADVNAWGEKQPALKISVRELANSVKRGMDLKAGKMSKQDERLKEEGL